MVVGSSGGPSAVVAVSRLKCIEVQKTMTSTVVRWKPGRWLIGRNEEGEWGRGRGVLKGNKSWEREHRRAVSHPMAEDHGLISSQWVWKPLTPPTPHTHTSYFFFNSSPSYLCRLTWFVTRLRRLVYGRRPQIDQMWLWCQSVAVWGMQIWIKQSSNSRHT